MHKCMLSDKTLVYLIEFYFCHTRIILKLSLAEVLEISACKMGYKRGMVSTDLNNIYGGYVKISAYLWSPVADHSLLVIVIHYKWHIFHYKWNIFHYKWPSQTIVKIP
jgi:hypothetical protein